jgi:ppGpp synthetase/RelA/SpoT-type nucleotidyltranferase
MAGEAPATPEQWASDYAQRRHVFQGYASRLERLIGELLEEQDLDLVQIESRAKDVDSFVDKLKRRPGKYSDPIQEMRDLAGVRIICYYLSDVAIVGNLIEQEFVVDAENSWTRETRADVDRFGYASDHYVVSCTPTREGLPEWSAYTGIHAEIQVRTVLQHAWAAIDHKLAYKRESDVPKQLRRQLSRVSALLEVGDEQFEAVRSASQGLDASYDARARAGELEIPVDASSLPAYLGDSDVVAALTAVAREIGFTVEDRGSTGIGELVNASVAAGLSVLADLDACLVESQSWSVRALQALWDARPSGAGWTMPVAFLLATLVWIAVDTPLETIAALANVDAFFTEALVAARAARGE